MGRRRVQSWVSTSAAVAALMLFAPAADARTPSPGEAALEKLARFARSRTGVEDRNGDGKPDLWRTFYSSGRLKTLTTSARADGRPDLRYHYAENGRVTLREYADPRSAEFNTHVRTIRANGRWTERVEGPGLTLTTGRSPRGYYVRRAEYDLNRDGRVDRVSTVILSPSSWAQEVPGGSTCGSTGAPLSGSSPDLASLLGQIGDQIEVDADCEGYRPGGGAGTPMTREQLRLRAAQAIQSGLQCLQGRGPAGSRMANELLSQVFATPDRKLKLKCSLGAASPTCPGAVGDTCGRASRFDDPTFPSIALGSCRNGEADLNATLFHESLHLAGSDGHQHLHNYSDVEATEHVEPCAQCCQGPAVTTPQGRAQRADQCALCDDSPAADPTAHTLRYGAVLMLERNSELALRELRKVLAVRPNNYEAWLNFLNASIREFQSSRRPSLENLFQLRMALREVYRLRDHPEQRDQLPLQVPRAVNDEGLNTLLLTLGDRLIQQHLLEGPPPLGVSSMDPAIREPYLAFRDHQAEGALLMEVCSSMSDLTTPSPDPREERARTCYSRAQGVATALVRDAAAIRAATRQYVEPAADSEGPARLSLSARTVETFENYATRYGAGVQCVSHGTPIEECAAARAPTPAASPAAPRASDESMAPACPPPSPFR